MTAYSLFQSTHPQGVRRGLIMSFVFKSVGFNPRTRRGCDADSSCLLFLNLWVSIHAPAGGATPGEYGGLLLIVRFNPRTRRGCDRRDLLAEAGYNVSIHAPAGGATRFISAAAPLTVFQSTHPQGVRP